MNVLQSISRAMCFMATAHYIIAYLQGTEITTIIIGGTASFGWSKKL